MATVQLQSLAKKETILSKSVEGPGVDVYQLVTAIQGEAILFEGLIWRSAPAESLTSGYPAAPSQTYDWSSAPSWATWAAFDENGLGHWFIERPILDEYNGRWRSGVTERRSWPMTSNVVLTRGWRASLGYRPVAVTTATSSATQASSSDCTCPTLSDTVVTDVTGYIAVTMGDAVLVPDCCSQVTSTPELAPGAVILLQESDDGVDWTSFGRLVLTSINSPVSFEYTPSKTLLRAVVSSIWGTDTFATVTVSGPV